MILHIPHSSRNTLDRHFLCDVEVELDRMTDHDTDLLFEADQTTRVVFPVSRLICDVERFRKDAEEPMAIKGMGVCYTTNSFGKPLRHVSDDERRFILEELYDPHHERLNYAVARELNVSGQSLIIDCHSFSDTPLPHEDRQSYPRPDFCIGTDDYHTPETLCLQAVTYFRSLGYTVAINNPFSGSLVPLGYYRVNPNVKSLMIEVNRSLYRGENFNRVANDIRRFLNSLKRTKHD